MFKRVSGRITGHNVTITIKRASPKHALYFISDPNSNVIYTRTDPNRAIKLAYSYFNDNTQANREIVVRDDQNAWPKNYPPLR